ncbi:carbohydrate ABC transporter permease [Anaerocolumna jejuensis]|uniref:carbohydrate ABC transporter permease n=1 Tax=Anaerocolumna jejuensis TaxID=259063 RepID=UPI003F7B49DE
MKKGTIHIKNKRNFAVRLKNMTPIDILYQIFVYVTVTVFALICLYPILYVFAISITPYAEYLENPLKLIPGKLDLSAYYKLLHLPLIYSGYRVTIFITIAGTLLNIILLCITAYPLSKKDLKGRNVILALITFTMFFNGGLIPNFYIIRSLHLYDTIWALILPGCLGAYNLILMKNFISGIPASLEESAYIDGANEFQVLWRIIVPLSKPAIATFVIFHVVSQWNSYFNAIIYTSKRSLWPLMLVLREMVVDDGMALANQSTAADSLTNPYTLKMATIIVCVLPILCIYPFMQRYFTKGLLVGSVKG